MLAGSKDLIGLVYIELQLRRDAFHFRSVCKQWNRVGLLNEAARRARFLDTCPCTTSMHFRLGTLLTPVRKKCTAMGEFECGLCFATLCANHTTFYCYRCRKRICQDCCISQAPACTKCVQTCEETECTRKSKPLLALVNICSDYSRFQYCACCDKFVCTDCSNQWHGRHEIHSIGALTTLKKENLATVCFVSNWRLYRQGGWSKKKVGLKSRK